jgi:D-threo-aldose 1-dehydrogenase
MRYTLLEQDVLDSEFPRCEERGVGIIIGGGYIPGFLRPAPFPARCTIMPRPAPRSWSG